MHVLAAKERESSLERFFCDLEHMPYDKTVPIENGSVDVPERPGLGADPDPELMRFPHLIFATTGGLLPEDPDRCRRYDRCVAIDHSLGRKP